MSTLVASALARLSRKDKNRRRGGSPSGAVVPQGRPSTDSVPQCELHLCTTEHIYVQSDVVTRAELIGTVMTVYSDTVCLCILTLYVCVF